MQVPEDEPVWRQVLRLCLDHSARGLLGRTDAALAE